jgi:hypothetical protein
MVPMPDESFALFGGRTCTITSSCQAEAISRTWRPFAWSNIAWTSNTATDLITGIKDVVTLRPDALCVMGAGSTESSQRQCFYPSLPQSRVAMNVLERDADDNAGSGSTLLPVRVTFSKAVVGLVIEDFTVEHATPHSLLRVGRLGDAYDL